jgi:hypothetical protein
MTTPSPTNWYPNFWIIIIALAVVAIAVVDVLAYTK